VSNRVFRFDEDRDLLDRIANAPIAELRPNREP
jgi:hypothetical protein